MKGFTLIELLAVIVIIAVIALITVPLITSGVEDARIASVVASNRMVAKGLETYIFDNEDILPTSVGQTIEIPLQALIDVNYLKTVKSPYSSNNCTGYILLTKTEKGFTNNPHINCLEPVSSSTDDHLLFHYTFDDFQEPTQNVSLNDGQSGVSPFSGDGSPSLSIIDSSVTFRGRKVARFITGTSGNFYINGATKVSTATAATNWTSTFYIKRVDGSPLTTVGTYMYISNNTNVNTTVSVIPAEDGWYKVIRTRDSLVAGYPTLFGVYGLGTSTEYYIADWMIEPKAYATEYVSGSRDANITDYSASSNSFALGMITTPTWIYDQDRKSGAYQFNNSIINIATGNTYFPLNTFTMSAWIKTPGLGSGMSINGIMSITYGLTFYLDGSGKLNFRMDNGTSIPAISYPSA